MTYSKGGPALVFVFVLSWSRVEPFAFAVLRSFLDLKFNAFAVALLVFRHRIVFHVPCFSRSYFRAPGFLSRSCVFIIGQAEQIILNRIFNYYLSLTRSRDPEPKLQYRIPATVPGPAKSFGSGSTTLKL
jgi:hypothetical protein